MVGVKRRAGLFVTDVCGNTCCVVRSIPYQDETCFNSAYRKTPLSICTKQFPPTRCMLNDERPDVYGGPDSRWRCDDTQRIQSVDCSNVFLEMIQIPRGLKEKGDTDLVSTAVREFCEETLCANDTLYVSTDPMDLYWYDAGDRWSYTIYTATVDSRFYFAFNTSAMRPVDVTFRCSPYSTFTYRLHTAAVSLTRTGGTIGCVVVMNTTDYVDYMRKVQLAHYGENNYLALLARIEKHCSTFTSVFRGFKIPAAVQGSASVTSSPSIASDSSAAGNIPPLNASQNQICPAWVANGGSVNRVATENRRETVHTISRRIRDCIKDNRDIYVNAIDLCAYSSTLRNACLRWRWSSYWRNAQ